MKTLKIQPGLLVCLSTRTEGGITYERHNETTRSFEGGAKVTEWETVKTITDAEEFKRATEARSKVRALFRSVCCWTPFGLICPAAERDRLTAAAAEAETVRTLFNGSATTCRVEFSWLSGEIAESNEQAAKAIQQELAAILGEMELASQSGSIKEIRDASNRAHQLTRLLDQQSDAKQAASKAVKAARKLAREITKRVVKGGEELAAVLEHAETSPITVARFAFLGDGDIEDEREPLGFLTVEPMRFAALEEGDDLSDDLDGPELSPEELEAFHAKRAAELGLVGLSGPGVPGSTLASAADASPFAKGSAL